MQKIAKNLKELRAAFNYTQGFIAQKLGVAISAVHYWETGASEPKANYIFSLARLFNVSADYLLGLEDEAGEPLQDTHAAKPAPSPAPALREDQRKWLELYEEMSDIERAQTRGYGSWLVKSRKDAEERMTNLREQAERRDTS
jgi:transcriptional regulator with XRE-family HTH domain